MEFGAKFKEEVYGLIATMEAENLTEQEVPGNLGLTLLREDNDGLNKRKEKTGGVVRVLEYREIKYYLCSF